MTELFKRTGMTYSEYYDQDHNGMTCKTCTLNPASGSCYKSDLGDDFSRNTSGIVPLEEGGIKYENACKNYDHDILKGMDAVLDSPFLKVEFVKR